MLKYSSGCSEIILEGAIKILEGAIRFLEGALPRLHRPRYGADYMQVFFLQVCKELISCLQAECCMQWQLCSTAVNYMTFHMALPEPLFVCIRMSQKKINVRISYGLEKVQSQRFWLKAFFLHAGVEIHVLSPEPLKNVGAYVNVVDFPKEFFSLIKNMCVLS